MNNISKVTIILFLATITFLLFNVKIKVLYDSSKESILIHKNDNVLMDNSKKPNGIYVLLGKEDYKDLKNKEVLFNRLLYTNDIQLVNEFVSQCRFKQTGYDICTCSSSIYITRNDTIIEKCECCFSENMLCLQSPKFGFIKSISSNVLSYFDTFDDKIGIVKVH